MPASRTESPLVQHPSGDDTHACPVKLAAPRAPCSPPPSSSPPAAYAQQVPAGYPADYQKILDGAKKEGKVIIYSTTDTKAAGPIIKGFEALYPDVKVEYNDMNSTELYNRYISEQAAGGAAATSSGARRWTRR